MMKVKIEEVRRLLVKSASRHVSEQEARYFSDCIVASHLSKSPRMLPIKEAISDLKVWKKSSAEGVETIVDQAGVTILDFNGLAPSLKIRSIHDEIERKARKNGIAAIGFRNSAGITTLNMWSTELSKRDMIAICMFNGGTECCVPYGARQGVLGTNPIAYVIPTATDPIVLDMATTEIPFFELKTAKEKNLPLKPNVALDQDGALTTDANQALNDDGVANLLPMGGGFKGYGIMMLIEILTGPLVHSLLSTQQTPGWNPTEYGFLMIGIDVGSFVDVSLFKQNVSKMCAKIRSLPPAEGFFGVQIPGDRGHANHKRCVASGEMDIDETLLEALRGLAR
ncbi:Ldh family oxidoreductase [Desulfosarcina sp.]|uniref:Ldh family oxidoreductase n=1 Tax=Desulfosarcina sp. TaxID=2027861 RepID=UPI003970969C